MSTTVEEQARRLLWLFPRWMRADRGEEAVSLVLDLVPPGTDRLPRRSRWDLIRAGLHARRRGTPPLRVWLRLVWMPNVANEPVVPLSWRPWLATAVNGRALMVLSAVVWPAIAMLPAFILAGSANFGVTFGLIAVAGWSLGAAFFLVVRRKAWRARVLVANGFALDGRPLPPHEVAVIWSAAPITNVWVLPILLGFVASGSLYTPILWQSEVLDEPAGSPLVAVALVAVCTALTWWWAGRRLHVDDPASPASVSPPAAARLDPIYGVLGIAIGGAWAWTVVIVGLALGLHLAVCWTLPAMAVAVLLRVRSAERSLRRRVGIWDLLPSAGPELVVRPTTDVCGDRHSGPGPAAFG